ncbi:hypothetical protein AB4224_25415 [Vibrio lentus]
MIRISDSCLVGKDESTLDKIALEHLNNVNGKKGTTVKTPRENSIYKKILDYKSTVQSQGYLRDRCGGDHDKQQRIIEFCEYFLSNNGVKIDEVILAKPNQFESIIEDINAIVRDEDWKTQVGGENKHTEFYNKVILDLFSYKKYRSTKACTDVYYELIGRKSYCFYCNVSPIAIPRKNKNGKMVNQMDLQLDHFYLRAKYPYLSLCFYNLIPCCSTCNTGYHGGTELRIDTHINPYSNCFNSEYIFELDSDELANLSVGCMEPFTGFELVLRPEATRQHDMTCDDFSLNTRYEDYLENVNNLAYMYKKNVAQKNDNLENFCEVVYGPNFASVPNEPSDIPKAPLGKLLRDVIHQIGDDSEIK